MKPSLAPVAFLFVAFAATPAVGQFIEPPPPPPDSLSTLAVPAVVERLSELPLVDESVDGAGGFVKDENGSDPARQSAVLGSADGQ